MHCYNNSICDWVQITGTCRQKVYRETAYSFSPLHEVRRRRRRRGLVLIRWRSGIILLSRRWRRRRMILYSTRSYLIRLNGRLLRELIVNSRWRVVSNRWLRCWSLHIMMTRLTRMILLNRGLWVELSWRWCLLILVGLLLGVTIHSRNRRLLVIGDNRLSRRRRYSIVLRWRRRWSHL